MSRGTIMHNLQIITPWPIRRKLLLLLMVLFLPATGIIVSSSLDHRKHEIEGAKKKALLLVQSLAAQQEQIATGTKQMLSTLAYLPDVQNLDTKACNELFCELNNRYPYYSGYSAEIGHAFRSKSATCSGANRPPCRSEATLVFNSFS